MQLLLTDGRTISLDRPRIMGVLNVTPDSFSDGGQFADSDAAVVYGLAMAQQGADVIDVGGESTRPGAEPVDAQMQKRRVLPVIEKLHRQLAKQNSPTIISVDTTLVDVAGAALDAGAAMINDVWAGRDRRNAERGDEAMFQLAAQRGAAIVLMHMQGTPATMQDAPSYLDVVSEVADFLHQRCEAALAVGVRSGQIIIDPGIGFGKSQKHNLELLGGLERLAAGGYPVLLGASRKRFMRDICGVNAAGADEPARAALQAATCATTVLGVAAGVAMFRVHDVAANRAAADLAHAIGPCKQAIGTTHHDD